MTPLSRALQSLYSIESALLGVYTPQATTALGHARIAILAIGEAQKQQRTESDLDASTSTV